MLRISSFSGTSSFSNERNASNGADARVSVTQGTVSPRTGPEAARSAGAVGGGGDGCIAGPTGARYAGGMNLRAAACGDAGADRSTAALTS